MAISSNHAFSGALPILQRELGAYFRSPVATIYLVVFLLAALGFPFFLGNFYRSNHAGLELFFMFHPWLYLFLIPAIGMSVWAEEFQHSTILLLFTLPVSVGAAVVAKFLAAWAFLALALLLTFPIVATVFYLGNPDIGPILTGYLGSFLMAGTYLAITTCTSAIGRNQIVSYVLSTIICLVLVLLGQGALMDLLNPIFPVWLADLIAQFSFSTHFHSLSLGVIDLRDIVYFSSLIIFFLVVNTIIIHVKMGRLQFRRSLATILQLFVAVISVNVITYYLPVRIDVTQDRVYTISESTKTVLSGIKGQILLKYYFSQSNDQLSPEYKLYAQRVQDLLKEYVRLSDHKLKLEVIDPKPDTYEEEWAQNYGIQRKTLPNGSTLYFGLVALMWDRESVIPSFDPKRTGQLEYDLTQRILRISREQSERIGILGPADIKDRFATHFSGMLSELQRSYDVSFLSQDSKEIPKEISLLFTMWTNEDRRAKDKSDFQTEKIDRFLQRGGKLLLVVDPLFNKRSKPQQHGKPLSPVVSAQDFPYTGLLNKWGVQFTHASIVGDLKNAGAVQNPGFGTLRYPFLVNIGTDGLSHNLSVTKTLEKMVFLNSGALQSSQSLQAEQQSEFIPLISSSGESGSYDFYRLPILELQKSPIKHETQTNPLGFFSPGSNATINDRGPHFSMLKDPSENIGDLEKIDQKLKSHQQPKILAGLVNQRTGSAAKVPIAIIVADADFMSNDLAISSLQSADDVGQRGDGNSSADAVVAVSDQVREANAETANIPNTTYQQPNDNINFLLNAIDYLSQNDRLAGIRSRGQNVRDFTRVKALEKDAQEQFLQIDKQMQAKLGAVRSHLKQAIKHKEFDQKSLFSAKQQAEIKKYLDEESASKKELRSARSLLRANINALGNRLLFWNLVPVPLLVALSGGVYFWRRSRKYKTDFAQKVE